MNGMKLAVLTGIEKIEVVEASLPSINKDTEVLIQMAVVGICGSDIHYYTQGKIGSMEVEYPFTVGHEGAGIVKEIGSKVTQVKPGDRVAIEPSMSCGECDQCQAGRPHTCRNNLFLGCPGQYPGNLAEYIVVPQGQCLLLKDEQHIDEGALSEPLSIGLYAIKQAALTKDQSVAILGFGPIGLSIFLMAKYIGVEKILVSDKISERLEIAKKMGADWLTNPLSEVVSDKANSDYPEQFDVVFECCGQQSAFNTATEILKPGGKIAIVGIPEFDRWSFRADLARRHEISIINIRRQNQCEHETLEMLASKKISANEMITHRFHLNQIAEAFDLVKNYKDGVMKAFIHFL